MLYLKALPLCPYNNSYVPCAQNEVECALSKGNLHLRLLLLAEPRHFRIVSRPPDGRTWAYYNEYTAQSYRTNAATRPTAHENHECISNGLCLAFDGQYLATIWKTKTLKRKAPPCRTFFFDRLILNSLYALPAHHWEPANTCPTSPCWLMRANRRKADHE